MSDLREAIAEVLMRATFFSSYRAAEVADRILALPQLAALSLPRPGQAAPEGDAA